MTSDAQRVAAADSFRHTSLSAPAPSGLGWRHVTVRRWSQTTTAGAMDVPASTSLRLVLVSSGRCVVESADLAANRRTVLAPGSIGLINVGVGCSLRWQVIAGEKVEALVLLVDPRVIADASAAFPDAPALPAIGHYENARIADIIRDIGWALDNRAQARYADAAAHLLAARLITSHPISLERRGARAGGLSSPDLVTLTEYMDAHLSETVTLDDLATVVNISKHHLVRQFKAAVGVPPHRYLQRLRMDHAAHLLRTSDLTVSSIARICAYASERQFTASFARHTGLAPSRYRKANEQ